MKKSVMEMVHTMVNGGAVNMDELRAEVNAEWERMEKEQQEKVEAYDAAKEVVRGIVSDKPMTAKEIYEASKNWPRNFTVNKVGYGLRALWDDIVDKHDNGKNPNTYTAKAV